MHFAFLTLSLGMQVVKYVRGRLLLKGCGRDPFHTKEP